MKTPTEPLTIPMIRHIRAEARDAGDDVQVWACDVALGEEDPITSPREIEERFSGGGYTRHEMVQIRAIDSCDTARRLCAEAINGARAMDDSRPFVRVVP